MKRFSPLLSILILLVSCIYTGAGRTDLVRKMGSAGDAVITADIRRLRESSLKGLLPEGYEEVLERTDRIAIALSPNGDGYPLPAAEWDVEGIAFGRLSATEVGTLLRWLPDYVHSRTGEYYRATDGSGEIGIPEDGIVLFSSSSYGKAYESIFVDSREHIPASASDAMESALIGIWIDDLRRVPCPINFDLLAGLSVDMHGCAAFLFVLLDVITELGIHERLIAGLAAFLQVFCPEELFVDTVAEQLLLDVVEIRHPFLFGYL